MEKLEGLLGGISVELAHGISMFLPDEDPAIRDPVDTNAALKKSISPPNLPPSGPKSF